MNSRVLLAAGHGLALGTTQAAVFSVTNAGESGRGSPRPGPNYATLTTHPARIRIPNTESPTYSELKLRYETTN